jgi:hypothetical protein
MLLDWISDHIENILIFLLILVAAAVIYVMFDIANKPACTTYSLQTSGELKPLSVTICRKEFRGSN